jgi:hypothetical protein
MNTNLWNNISQVLIQLQALSKEIDTVQEEITQQSNTFKIQLHCGPGEWHRIAYLNMTDSSQQCPCGRQFSTEGSCATTQYFAAHQYSKVCGRVIGYQVASPDGFSSVENTNRMN